MTATGWQVERTTAERENESLRREVQALRAKLAFYERTHLPSLTPRQRDLMRFIRRYMADNETAPSFEEMARAMGYESLGTVHEQLTKLQRKGYITRRYNEARSITIAPAAA